MFHAFPSCRITATPFVEIKRSLYLGVTMKRKEGQSALLAYQESGDVLDDTVKTFPERILQEVLPDIGEPHLFQIHRMAYQMKLHDTQVLLFRKIVEGMVRAFYYFDALSIEINPLVLTEEGTLVASSVAMSVDERALFRQPEMKYLFHENEVPETKPQGSAHLSFFSFPGTIGLLTNGQGPLMTLIDLVKVFQGSLGSVVNVSAQGKEDKILSGLDLLLEDESIDVIVVSIFAGIANCEDIARSLKKALESHHRKIPLVVKLEGMNASGGKRLLKNAFSRVSIVSSFEEAIQLATSLSKRRGI
jgi:succinyl-CoA synthetase beta subunit